MKQYLLSVYQPDGDPPARDLDEIMRDVDALARGDARRPARGSSPAACTRPSTATVVRPRDGEVLITDGPFAEGKEHIGGFTIIEAPDLDAALEWGRKVARATDAADRGAARSAQ